MADFCFQCNLDMGFGPYSDFDHYGEFLKPGQLAAAMCEGCGPILVDHKGRCADSECRPHAVTTLSIERWKVYRSGERWAARRSGRLGWLYRLRDRLAGSPWDPGLIHELRYRWRCWRYPEPVEVDWGNLDDA